MSWRKDSPSGGAASGSDASASDGLRRMKTGALRGTRSWLVTRKRPGPEGDEIRSRAAKRGERVHGWQKESTTSGKRGKTGAQAKGCYILVKLQIQETHTLTNNIIDDNKRLPLNKNSNLSRSFIKNRNQGSLHFTKQEGHHEWTTGQKGQLISSHLTSLSELCHSWLDGSSATSDRFPTKATVRPSVCRTSANLQQNSWWLFI